MRVKQCLFDVRTTCSIFHNCQKNIWDIIFLWRFFNFSSRTLYITLRKKIIFFKTERVGREMRSKRPYDMMCFRPYIYIYGYSFYWKFCVSRPSEYQYVTFCGHILFIKMYYAYFNFIIKFCLYTLMIWPI